MNALTRSILRNRNYIKEWFSSILIIFRHYGRGTDRDNSMSDKQERETKNNKTSGCDQVAPKMFSKEEQKILLAHKKAIEANEDMYVDPATGYNVLTEKTLRNRRECCGNACRHCPYGHVNVPEHLKTKKYNSMFYI